MSARGKARSRAVEILFEAEQRSATVSEVIQRRRDSTEQLIMPAVDRVILRVGAWELLFNDEVPDGVAVSEAVAQARTLSTDDSPAFVNGLLGRIQQLKPTLLA